MKTPALLATSLLALAAFAHAVPTEINYQGVLTDQNGNPINGVRAMQLKIYDAPTGGTLLYSEDLGNVSVQDGIYSFTFGANGTSNALTTETIAIANGTATTFQKVLSAPTVVSGSVTVTDGTYTWDQTNGSSNENDFSVAYSPNLRRVTVTYYIGAPAAGKTITTTYRSPNSGITGALADIGNAWSEVSIGGAPQNPRQKVLAVPLALTALKSLNSTDTLAQERINLMEKSFAQTAGLTLANATNSLNSNLRGGYLGIINKSTGWSVSETLPAYNKKVLGVILNYFARPWAYTGTGTLKFMYSDSSQVTINWSLSQSYGPTIIANPNTGKNVNSVSFTSSLDSQLTNTMATIVCSEISSLTFDANNIYANKIFVSPTSASDAAADNFIDTSIILRLSDDSTIISSWNEWVSIPNGGYVKNISILGRPISIKDLNLNLKVLTIK
jgi:hypothetical protein